MNKEHDIKSMSMDDATHIGIVCNYALTSLVRRPVLFKAGKTAKFIFTNPLNPQDVVTQHQTWLVESDNYWHIPGTPVKFDKITGEQFVDSCQCGLLHYYFLQLDSVVES